MTKDRTRQIVALIRSANLGNSSHEACGEDSVRILVDEVSLARYFSVCLDKNIES